MVASYILRDMEPDERDADMAERALEYLRNVAIHGAYHGFKYFDISPTKRRIYRQDGKPYYRTPVALCWNNDNYYLVAFSLYFDNPLASFRVDRMKHVIRLHRSKRAKRSLQMVSNYRSTLFTLRDQFISMANMVRKLISDHAM